MASEGCTKTMRIRQGAHGTGMSQAIVCMPELLETGKIRAGSPSFSVKAGWYVSCLINLS